MDVRAARERRHDAEQVRERDLVAALRRAGWTIVTADEAFADPVAAARPDVPVAQGTLTEALAWERGLPAPRWYARNDTRLADRLFAERVLHEPAAEDDLAAHNR